MYSDDEDDDIEEDEDDEKCGSDSDIAIMQ
jgi:hypothetical protein